MEIIEWPCIFCFPQYTMFYSVGKEVTVTMTDGPGSSQDRSRLPGLLVKDCLTVVTPSGECRIELCLGDITKLDHSNKVDVIFISAYGGN